ALAMEVGDRARRGLAKADGLANAEGNQMVVRIREDLFPRQHDHTARRASERAADAAVDQIVVTGDRDRVEALTLRFENQAPRRERAVAPHRAVRVQID